MHFIWYKKWISGSTNMCYQSGDYVLLPDPGYTDYLAGVLLADGKPVPLNLEPPHYLPDWSKVDSQIIDKTKLIYLTYPNNPTGSTATKEVLMKR